MENDFPKGLGVPQSNQGGIESELLDAAMEMTQAPQSNQGGIER